MFVAGEHCDKETMEWTKEVFDCPVLDNWWQTGEWSCNICTLMRSYPARSNMLHVDSVAPDQPVHLPNLYLHTQA